MKILAFLLAFNAGALLPVQARPVPPSKNPVEQRRDASLFADPDQGGPENSRAISGSVLDPSGAGVPGAQVTLTSANGSAVAATTDSTGTFRFEKLALGTYSIDVQASGFREGKLNINVGRKSLAPLRIGLAIASRSEVVTVGAQDSSVRITTDVAENQNANTVDRDALDRVPVFDQDYITTLSRFLDDNAIGTNGVTLVVNGVEANGPGVTPSAIQEVKIN